MYESALLRGRSCQIVTLGISSPASRSAPEDVGRLEGEPELDPVAGPLQVAAGQLGHPADAVAQRMAVHAEGPGRGLPVAVVLQERPQAGHQVAVLAVVVVGQGAEQAPGDGLQGGVLLPPGPAASSANRASWEARRRPRGSAAGRPSPNRAPGPLAWTASATASAAVRASAGPAASNRATTEA